MSERRIGNCILSLWYAFIKFLSLGLEVELKRVSAFYMWYHLMRIVDTENKPTTTSSSIQLFLLSYYNFVLGLHQSTRYELLIVYRNGILTLLVAIFLRESNLIEYIIWSILIGWISRNLGMKMCGFLYTLGDHTVDESHTSLCFSSVLFL